MIVFFFRQFSSSKISENVIKIREPRVYLQNIVTGIFLIQPYFLKTKYTTYILFLLFNCKFVDFY